MGSGLGTNWGLVGLGYEAMGFRVRGLGLGVFWV